MSPPLPLMVPGARPEGDPVQVTAPFDGSRIASVERSGPEALERALATAHALHRDRDAWLPEPRRIAILRDQVLVIGDVVAGVVGDLDLTFRFDLTGSEPGSAFATNFVFGVVPEPNTALLLAFGLLLLAARRRHGQPA